MKTKADIVDRLRSVGGYFDEAAQKHVSCREAAEEIEKLRNALAFLLDVKAHKDQHGKDEWYADAQPMAWEQAKAALRP